MNAPETINLKRLDTGLEESGFDALVAASVENAFYFSDVPLRSDLSAPRHVGSATRP